MTEFWLLGNNGYSVQDNPEPSRWVRPLVEAGFTYFEYFTDHLDPAFYSNVLRRKSEFVRETLRVIEKNGLEVVSIATGRLPYLTNLLSHPFDDMAEEGLRWCKGLADMAKIFGAKYITGHYDYITQEDLRRRPKFAVSRLIERLVLFAEYAAKKGVEAVFLEQMYTPHLKPYTIEESKKMLRALNRRSAIPVMLHMDCGHAAPVPETDANHTKADKDPYRWLEEQYPASEMIFVHLQQTDKASSRHWAFTREYNRKGMIRAERVVRSILKGAPKKAFLAFEMLYPRGTSLELIGKELRESREYFRRTFERMGFDVSSDRIKES